MGAYGLPGKIAETLPFENLHAWNRFVASPFEGSAKVR